MTTHYPLCSSNNELVTVCLICDYWDEAKQILIPAAEEGYPPKELTVTKALASNLVARGIAEMKNACNNASDQFARVCPPGERGAPGVAGTAGTNGTPGKPGTDGIPGEPGRDGIPGCKGEPGARGYPGRDGPPGFDGEPGCKGDTGSPGRPGTPGINGTPGTPGSNGSDGIPGQRGSDGEPGRNGSNGSNGLSPVIRVRVDDDNCVVFDTFDDMGGNLISSVKKCCDDQVIVMPIPSVNITKSCDPSGPYVEGDVITFMLEVCNTGNEPLTDLVITDPDATVQMPNVGNLAVGTCVTRTATMTVTESMVEEGGHTNMASVDGFGASGESVNSSDSHVITTEETVEPNPLVSIDKSCDPSGPYAEGDIVNFTLEVCNTGNENLTNLVITDPDASVQEPDVGDLAVGACAIRTATMTVTAAMVAEGGYTNRAVVNGMGAVSGGAVNDSDTHMITTEEEERETKTVCAKMASPINLNNEPPFSISGNTASWNLGNGITVTAAYANGFSNLFTGPEAIEFACPILDNYAENAVNPVFSWSVQGLNALACDGCEPCLDLEVGMWSIREENVIEFSQAITATDVVNMNASQGNTVFTNPNSLPFSGEPEEGSFCFFQPTVTGDGQLPITGQGIDGPIPQTGGAADLGPRICVKGGRLFLPVIVTCYADNNEFISAVDCDGNSVAENEIDFS